MSLSYRVHFQRDNGSGGNLETLDFQFLQTGNSQGSSLRKGDAECGKQGPFIVGPHTGIIHYGVIMRLLSQLSTN